MKISPSDQNLMLDMLYFMVQPYKMQGEAKDFKNVHFYTLYPQLRALRMGNPKTGNAGTSALLFWPLTPNFVKIHPFLLALYAVEPERRLSAYVYAGPDLLNH